MYITRVASNEKFKFSLKIILPFIISSPLLIATLFIDQIITETKKLNYEITLNLFKNSASLRKYINLPNRFLIILIISYLLLSLIIVVKITNIQYGPLRQKF